MSKSITMLQEPSRFLLPLAYLELKNVDIFFIQKASFLMEKVMVLVALDNLNLNEIKQSLTRFFTFCFLHKLTVPYAPDKHP
jgi:hypothetical protein